MKPACPATKERGTQASAKWPTLYTSKTLTKTVSSMEGVRSGPGERKQRERNAKKRKRDEFDNDEGRKKKRKEEHPEEKVKDRTVSVMFVVLLLKTTLN